MLVRHCQPKAVHVSAELLILSKDRVHSEEIAFYATIALLVVMCMCVSQAACLPGISDDETLQFGFVQR